MATSDKTLENIHKAALKFLVPLALEETYSTVVKEAIRLASGSHGSVVLMKQSGFRIVYSSNPDIYNAKIRKRGNTYKTFATQKAMVIDYANLVKFHPEYRSREKAVSSIILIPLVNRKKSIGVLSVLSGTHQSFTKKELEILEVFGSFASMAIAKAKLYNDIKHAMAMQEAFIALAAHELRTPLTTVSGYIQLLNAKTSVEGTVQKKWIKTLAQESKKLNGLVNNLIEKSKAPRATP